MWFYYEMLKKKYDRLYNDTINKNKDILIESFVSYYGEKHRDDRNKLGKRLLKKCKKEF